MSMFNDSETAKFEELVFNEIHVFYGVCGSMFKLGDMVFAALENPDDGYRSYLGSVQKIEHNGIFSPVPLAAVKVVPWNERVAWADEPFEGYAIIDVFDSHIWLIVGTDYYDSYYPCFKFDYTPKPSFS